MNRRNLFLSSAKAGLAAAFGSSWLSGKANAQTAAPAPNAAVPGAPQPAASEGTIYGTLGSPDATISISGRVLPPPPFSFAGTINESAKDSVAWWPPTVVPPRGAPNVLLIMTDDQGFGVSSTFGGLVPTPAFERVAKNGLRYNRFHSTALCSPTRAALITGRNHHEVGAGVIAELSTGFPGYDLYIGKDNATIGRILTEHGYITAWFGKNHNTPVNQLSTVGPFDQWPSGMGFQYFYGFMGGETDQYTPYLFQDHTQIFPWLNRPDYNLTTDLADEAVKYLRQCHAAAPNQPFFLYFAPGGSHAPHQPTREWAVKFRGKFDMGWNAMREVVFANQKRLGVIPQDAELTPWPDDLPKWDSLTADEKKLFARQAEIYAAFTAYTDHEIGRVIQEIEDQGKLDNTLIIYIVGDNGTSPEGTLLGTPNAYTAYNGVLDVPVADQLKFYDAWGSAETSPHMAVGWSWAFDTPFKWTKQIASHFGGTRQPMAISWPARIKDVGGLRSQFHHVIDITPTILDAVGINAPEVVDGITQTAKEGVSMVYTFDAQNTDAASTRKTQYFELAGHRGIYNDDWYANTTPPLGPWVVNAPYPDVLDYKWELYNLKTDYSQNRDLSAQMPDKLKEMQALFLAEARKYNVLPLDNRQFQRAITPRPNATAGRTEFTYSGELAGTPDGNAPSILNRSFTLIAEVTLKKTGSGMIVTDGGRMGGYGLYVTDGKPAFVYNFLDLQRFHCQGPHALTVGKHSIVFDYTYNGPGLAKGGSGELKVDGHTVATLTMPHSIPFLFPVNETFDVGLDTRSSVLGKDNLMPFRSIGNIDKLTVKLGPVRMADAERKRMQFALANAKD